MQTPKIITITISELCRLATPNSAVQRDIKPATVGKLIKSFEEWLDSRSFIALPMFFAVEDAHGGLVLHDGQHRLEALNHLSFAYQEEFATCSVAVTVFPIGTPTELLKRHFNAVNAGVAVAKNLQATFGGDWGNISTKLENWQLDLIETKAANYTLAAFNAADIIRMTDKLGVEVIDNLIQPMLNQLPEFMRRRSKSFREYAQFSSGFVNAILDLQNYTLFGSAAEMLKVVGEVLVTTPMNTWANNNPFPFFWVASKTGVTMAGTCQSRKAWIAKLLELLISNGHSNNVQIPQKLSSICAFLPPYSEVRLSDFVTEPATPVKAEKVKAEKAKVEKAKAKVQAEKAKAEKAKAEKAKAKVQAEKAKAEKAKAENNLVLELVDDPTTIII
jgi:hypothetical protein